MIRELNKEQVRRLVKVLDLLCEHGNTVLNKEEGWLIEFLTNDCAVTIRETYAQNNVYIAEVSLQRKKRVQTALKIIKKHLNAEKARKKAEKERREAEENSVKQQ